ncbi:MAG: inositol monophosphatase family protein [Candidatus Puniceispirillaceae bacterium]
MAGRSALINVMYKAADAASRRMMRDFGEVENLQVTKKGAADFVTRADLMAEEVIHAELAKARPDWGFLMEEGGKIAGADDEQPQWIIDPIDGTTNFTHGIPHFAISIAVMKQGKIIAGLILDPTRNECFFAESGKGAFMNERRIRVSGRRNFSEALFATGIPFLGRGTAQSDALFMAEMQAVMQKSAGIRRFGAAALDLAWVAAGRYDGFWETGLNLWDIAAGYIMVKEAGGFVSDFQSRDKALETGNIVAANSALHTPLLKLLREGRDTISAR